MNSKLGIKRTAITAAFLAAFGASGLAFAVYERENYSTTIAGAQDLDIGGGGSVEVTGALDTTGSNVGDVDFYRFQGFEGNVVTIDIDGGMKSSGRSVDTIIAIFNEAGERLWQNDDADARNPLDPGSTSYLDSLITNFRLPANGRYTVGVSSWPRFFQPFGGGALTSTALNGTSNGTYTLLISGVTPPVMQITVEIKPGTTGESAPINPKSKGNIPVALLSNSQFNALEVDQQSLRFGPEGNESSWLRCNKGTYVNVDDKLDLVCHFDTQWARFEPTDSEGIVRGNLKQPDGRRFEGRGYLKVVPVKRQQ